ncbi:MAG: type II secretion system protein [Planctomycetota bacterium]
MHRKSVNHPIRMRRTQTDAFTLIELLVVISVISILMSILLPSLNKAKESGKSAVCLANLHNLSFAWVAYATDNNEKMCAADTEWNGIRPWDEQHMGSWGNNHFWVSDGPGDPIIPNEFCNTETALRRGVLWPYLEMLDIYRCPSTRKDFIRSYAISHAMGSIHNLNGEWNFYSIDEIPMPSQKMVFMDHAPPYRDYTGMMQNTGSSIMIDTHTKSWGGTGLSPHKCKHNNAMNASFVDGHIEHWKWMDKRTIKLMKRQGIGFKEASIDNPDITRLLPAIRGARDRTF